MKTGMLFVILAIAWLVVMANRSLKRGIAKNDAEFLSIKNSLAAAWGRDRCSCGTPREKWKPLAMNREDKTLLLYCPQCLNLWEESMSMYGNKWRPVDQTYAKGTYDYSAEPGKPRR